MASSQEPKKHVYDVYMKQRVKCQGYLDEEKQSGGQNVQVLQKALLSAELSLGLLNMKNVNEEKAFIQSLQKHIESVLDSTYFQENVLVDKDFPKETCMGEITDILAQINLSIQLLQCQSEISKVLEKDTIQCLHWRPGALMYMYCCTIMNDANRKKTTDPKVLKECCRVGILHFQEMFQVYPTDIGEGDFTTNDENVARHLQAGIRSDTHMLALAYGGELCYWYHQLSSTDPLEKGDSPAFLMDNGTSVAELYQVLHTLCGSKELGSDGFEPVEIGKDFLSRYIGVAEGSVRMQSWNCDKPRELLQEFSKIT